jgi:hypothetical protein
MFAVKDDASVPSERPKLMHDGHWPSLEKFRVGNTHAVNVARPDCPVNFELCGDLVCFVICSDAAAMDEL